MGAVCYSVKITISGHGAAGVAPQGTTNSSSLIQSDVILAPVVQSLTPTPIEKLLPVTRYPDPSGATARHNLKATGKTLTIKQHSVQQVYISLFIIRVLSHFD